MRRLSRALVVALALSGVTCTDPEDPGTVIGTYQMTAYTWGAGDLPLPYVQQASTSPADTEEWLGGSITLARDSTTLITTLYAFCPKGVCGAARADTGYARFSHFPLGDSAGETMLLIINPYMPYQPVPVSVHGRRLVLANFWVYRR